MLRKKNAVGVAVYNQGHCELLWHKYTQFCMTLFYPIAMSQRKHLFKPLMCIFIPFLIYMLKSVKLKTCYILKLTNCCYFVIYFWVLVISNITSMSKDSQVHGPFHAGRVSFTWLWGSWVHFHCPVILWYCEADPPPHLDLTLLVFWPVHRFVCCLANPQFTTLCLTQGWLCAHHTLQETLQFLAASKLHPSKPGMGFFVEVGSRWRPCLCPSVVSSRLWNGSRYVPAVVVSKAGYDCPKRLSQEADGKTWAAGLHQAW